MQNVSSSNSQAVNVPQLRFPNFNKEWNKCELSSIFKKISTKNKDGIISNVISNSAKNGLIPQTDYFDKEIANSENTTGYYIINKGDFVYNPRKSTEAPYGPISVYNYENTGIVSPLYLCFKPQHEINTNFFKWLFKSPVWHRYIYMSGDSGARHDRVSMRDEVFFSMPLSIPEDAEQSKIADLLTLIENRIEKQQALVDNLKLYKRGVLSEIFQKQAWKLSPLTEVVALITDGDWIESKDQSDSGIRLIQTGNVGVGRFLDKEARAKYISNDTFQRLKCTEVFAGDILVSRLPSPAGRACIIPDIDSRMITAVDCTIIRVDESKILSGFLLQYLNSTEYFKIVDSFLAGGTRQRISRKNLESIKIPTPSLSVQREVFNFLSLLDKREFAAEDTLEELQKVKKALLQKMFI